MAMMGNGEADRVQCHDQQRMLPATPLPSHPCGRPGVQAVGADQDTATAGHDGACDDLAPSARRVETGIL